MVIDYIGTPNSEFVLKSFYQHYGNLIVFIRNNRV